MINRSMAKTAGISVDPLVRDMLILKYDISRRIYLTEIHSDNVSFAREQRGFTAYKQLFKEESYVSESWKRSGEGNLTRDFAVSGDDGASAVV